MKSWEDYKDVLNSRFDGLNEMFKSHFVEASFDVEHETTYPAIEAHDPWTTPGGQYLLNDTEGWNLSLKTLRRVPRYLIALTLLTDSNQINRGHYEYWRCTGAFSSISTMDWHPYDPRDLTEWIREPDKQPPIPFDKIPSPIVSWDVNDFHELCLLIKLGLFGEFDSALFFNRSNHLNFFLERIVSNSFQLSTRYGFPVLERLATNRITSGRAIDRGRLKNRIRYWIEDTDNSSTKRTLIEFKNIDNISPSDNITSQLDDITGEGDLSNLDDVDWSKGMIRRMGDRYRGPSQHGQKIFSGISVVIITLCCLAYWDTLNKDQFRWVRKLMNLWTYRKQLDHFNFRVGDERRYWNPRDFYNVYNDYSPEYFHFSQMHQLDFKN